MKYKTVIIGSGISGLLMGNRLYFEKKHNSTLIVDTRSFVDIINSSDDIPYYFNSIVDIPGLELKNCTIEMGFWHGNHVYHRATDEFEELYSKKILGVICKTTLKSIKKEREIYVPFDSENDGRRSSLIRILYNNIFKEIRINFNTKIEHIDAKNRTLFLENGCFIEYENLISTIALPDFLKIANVSNNALNFMRTPFYIAIFNIKETVYKAMYCTDSNVRFNRCAIIGKQAYLEAPREFNLNDLTKLEFEFLSFLKSYEGVEFYNAKYKWVFPGRFIELDSDMIVDLNKKLNSIGIFLLGRYGTWRFKLTENVWDDTFDIANNFQVT